MKPPKNCWTYVKVSLLTIFVVVAFVKEPETIDSGSSPPPFWLAIIPVVFLGLFLPPFLRAFKPTEQYLAASPWPAFPFSLFKDPFPFWHLCVWASLAGALPQTYHALWPYNHDQIVMALIMWSGGVGALLGITGAKRSLRRRLKDSTLSHKYSAFRPTEDGTSYFKFCLVRRNVFVNLAA
jgi:hypothetical protein